MYTVAAALLLALPALAAPLDKRQSNLMSSAVTMHNPPPRLWEDSTDSWQPCGGISFNGTRTDFPLSGGNISIVAYADAFQLGFNYATVENPTKNSQFNMLTHESVEPTYRGHHCSGAPDFGAMGLKAGDHVTIQARWMAGTAKTTLYSCADITLVDPANYIQPRSAMCFNGALDEATVDMNNYTDAGPKSGLSGGAKAGIAVGAVIGGLALIGAAAWFYKKNQNTKKAKADANLPGYHETHGAAVATPASENPSMGEKPRH